ncbi:hypothetical protein LguiB_007280 [Lonicera macranthoides]
MYQPFLAAATAAVAASSVYFKETCRAKAPLVGWTIEGIVEPNKEIHVVLYEVELLITMGPALITHHTFIIGVPIVSYLCGNNQITSQPSRVMVLCIFLKFQRPLDVSNLWISMKSIRVMGIRLPSLILNAKHICKLHTRNQSDVPKGHMAVYVGEIQKKRFVVPISYLNHPSFRELLLQAEEEFGFNHPMGGLTIPCREDAFIGLTAQLNCS